MRKGVLYSGLLHVAVALIALFGLPTLFQPDEVQRPIPVRIVDIGEVTTPPKQEEEPETTPEKTITPPPEPEPAKPAQQARPTPPPAPPAPPQPAPEPAPLPAPVVAPTPPEPVPEPKAEPEPEPELAKAEPLPVPKAKPEPPEEKSAERTPARRKPAEETPAEEEQAVTGFASVLKNVEKLKRQAEAAEEAPDREPAPEPVARQRNLSDEPLTLSEIDAIRAQIEQCWNVPVGARNAEDLVVEIRVTLNPDGSVFAMPEILNATRLASDPFFRAAAESAQRAVLKCSPLRMPSKKYSVWKEVTLRFDPSQMVQ